MLISHYLDHNLVFGGSILRRIPVVGIEILYLPCPVSNVVIMTWIFHPSSSFTDISLRTSSSIADISTQGLTLYGN